MVIQLLVVKETNIWMDGKRISLDDVNNLPPGSYTVDDVRGSRGVLIYLGLYSVKPSEPPTEKPAKPAEQPKK
jgi:hypothetical protein